MVEKALLQRSMKMDKDHLGGEGKGVNTIARELHTNRTKVYLEEEKREP